MFNIINALILPNGIMLGYHLKSSILVRLYRSFIWQPGPIAGSMIPRYNMASIEGTNVQMQAANCQNAVCSISVRFAVYNGIEHNYGIS